MHYMDNSTKLPITEEFADEILSLPMYPEIETQELVTITAAIKDFFSKMSYTTQTIKWLARQILPPFVLNRFQAKSYTFRGAYEKLEDVPKSSGYYNDKSYLELREEINRLVSKHGAKICQLPSSNPRSQISNLLPLLLALLSNKDLRVLDYGGGAGQTFLKCCEIINTQSIQYYIYDLGEVTQIGKECIRDSQYESQVHFINKIDNLSFIDVVYMGSVLQYLTTIECS